MKNHSENQAFSLSNASPNTNFDLYPQFCSLLIWDWACDLAVQPLWSLWDRFYSNVVLNVSVESKSGFPTETDNGIFYWSLWDWATFPFVTSSYWKLWQNYEMITTSNWAILQEHLKQWQVLRPHGELLSLYSQNEGRFWGSVSSHYNLKSNFCQAEQFLMSRVRHWHAACSNDVHSGKQNCKNLAVVYN